MDPDIIQEKIFEAIPPALASLKKCVPKRKTLGKCRLLVHDALLACGTTSRPSRHFVTTTCRLYGLLKYASDHHGKHPEFS
jgi:hypothetical protein